MCPKESSTGAGGDLYADWLESHTPPWMNSVGEREQFPRVKSGDYYCDMVISNNVCVCVYQMQK